jgi:hypothetical protein
VLELDTPTGLAVALKFLFIMESIPKKVGGGSVSVAYRIIPSTPSAASDPLCPVLASAKRIGAAAVKELLELKQQGKDMFAESCSLDKKEKKTGNSIFRGTYLRLSAALPPLRMDYSTHHGGA